MPDSWETSKGLNPNNAADGASVTKTGYSNLEMYLHSLAGGTVVYPTSAPTTAVPTATPIAPSPTPTSGGCTKKADYDGNCKVNIVDYGLFISHFDSIAGQDKYQSKMDLSQDGKIDIKDFYEFIKEFNT